MGPVFGSTGRTVTALLIVVAAATAGCAAERAAPVVTPRPPPPTTVPVTTELPPTSVPSTADPRASTTTAPSTNTTVPRVPADAWTAFDMALASKLLGSGDFALSVAVAVDGTLVHQGAFGYRVPPPLPPELTGGTTEPETSSPSTRNRTRPDGVETKDRFRIASISKVLTATVVLQLVEEGRLELDQPVGRLLGEHVGAAVTDPGVAAVTVHQLLSHTSGLSGYRNLMFGGGADSCTTAARIGLAGTLAIPPARQYMYSNFGYCLLGLLIEQVTGRPYEAAVRERLLRPLGIRGMRLAGTIDPFPNEVQHPSVPTRNYMEVLGAAGAWVATPADIVRILDSLDPAKPGWHPLSRRTFDLMRRPVRKVQYPRRDDHWYGLGLINSADGSWGHTGTVENTHAMVLARPDGVTWSVLVSGLYPWDTDDLRSIFDQSMEDAGIALP
jgi:D-alanyl-D-alanine carboxypeptidase